MPFYAFLPSKFPLLAASCAGMEYSPPHFRGYKFRHAHPVSLIAAGTYLRATQVSDKAVTAGEGPRGCGFGNRRDPPLGKAGHGSLQPALLALLRNV